MALLSEYKKKRDFRRTSEPPPDRPAARKGEFLSFVIQKHAARRLHYDFRLEASGVLKSWAVPKGPSMTPGKRRLAVRTEDHPLSYGSFAGVIPEGEYGAGKVEIWDKGLYANITEKRGRPVPVGKAIEQGHVKVLVAGKRIKGAFLLTRMQGREESGKENWLLIKAHDAPAAAYRRGGISLAARTVPPRSGGALRPPEMPLRDLQKRPPPEWLPPMLATLTDRRFSDKDWIYESKLDGERVLAFRTGRSLKLLSRNRKLLNSTYPEIVAALERQPSQSFIVDGEVVVEGGRMGTFSRLQERMHDPQSLKAKEIPVTYFLFDLLYMDGYDVTRLELRLRKEALAKTIAFGGALRYLEHREKEGAAYYKDSCRGGWEGVIAKRAASLYRGGRSPEWLKFKCTNRQEFVIGGFTDPQGSRTGLGALLLGFYRGKELLYAGKVGTGFNTGLLAQLGRRLIRLERPGKPFANEVPDRRGVHWVKPALVADVDFAEWTTDGRLRHPSFVGLRRDKAPSEVILEKPA